MNSDPPKFPFYNPAKKALVIDDLRDGTVTQTTTSK